MLVLPGCMALAEYILIPNLKDNTSTQVYIYFIADLTAAAAFKSRKIFHILRYKALFYALVFILLAVYDYLTLKTEILVLPYFPWCGQLALAALQRLLLRLITGTACGCSRTADYWLSPFMKLLGAIPYQLSGGIAQRLALIRRTSGLSELNLFKL